MKIVAAGSLLLATALAVRAQDNFADTVVSYVPGSTNDLSFQNPGTALGAPTASAAINNPPFGTSQICYISPGGELTLGFNAPILNNPTGNAEGMDFTIFGNDFFISGSGGKFSGTSDHPGLTVWVSQNDVNFYELDVPNGYGADDSFPTQGNGNPLLPVNPALTLSSFVGQTEAQALSLYNGSAGGASFSISWAVDANGNPVDLSSVNEIEIIPTTGYGLVDAVARVEAVPEPATVGLFCTGAMLFGLGRRRKGNPVRFHAKSKIKPIKIMRVSLMLILGLLTVSSARAVTFTENFTNDPAQNGWQVFGDTNLFQWTNDVMEVTWDSTQPNSYFYHPLGTTLTIADSFTICFDIQLHDLQCLPNPGIANLGVGLFNYNEATNSGFSRPDGFTPDLCEFDYYPDDGVDENPEVSASLTDDVGGVTNYPDFYFIYNEAPMNDGVTYHVALSHAAGDPGLSSTVYTNGQVYATMGNAYFEGFANFALDTLSISSYEQDSSYDAYDLLAHGTVSNFVVTFSGVSRNLIGTINNGIFQVYLGTYTNWNYMLERSTNLVGWSGVTPCASGNGHVLTLCDTNAPTTQAFYRVKASQP